MKKEFVGAVVSMKFSVGKFLKPNWVLRSFSGKKKKVKKKKKRKEKKERKERKND